MHVYQIGNELNLQVRQITSQIKNRLKVSLQYSSMNAECLKIATNQQFVQFRVSEQFEGKLQCRKLYS